MLTAGDDKYLRLFEIDGEKNKKHISKGCALFCAKLLFGSIVLYRVRGHVVPVYAYILFLLSYLYIYNLHLTLYGNTIQPSNFQTCL